MNFRLLFLTITILLWHSAAAESSREPLYIVNGTVWTTVSDIPEKNIEKIETLPADDATIAKYGQKANNGVVLITLCYDQAAVFPEAENFSEYIATQVKWTDKDPTARFVMRFTVEADGRLLLTASGKKVAEKIYERHTMLTEFFIRLGVEPEIASDDACKIEHNISDETFQRVKDYLARHAE